MGLEAFSFILKGPTNNIFQLRTHRRRFIRIQLLGACFVPVNGAFYILSALT